MVSFRGAALWAGRYPRLCRPSLVQSPRLREPLYAVDAFEPFHNGLLYYFLTVGNGEEFGVEAVALDGEGPVGGNEALPGQGPGPLKELLKAESFKTAQLYKHPLAYAKTDVGPGDGLVSPGKKYPAVFGGDPIHIHAPELLGDGTLQTQQAGDAELVIHSVLLLNLWCKVTINSRFV